MKTVLTTSPVEAAGVIRRGGLTAFPTETVYGLGANVFNERAIERIFIAKGRPSDNPLIAHVAEPEQIELLVSEITDSAKKFIDVFFPAPLTIVLPKSEHVPLIATAGLQTIGVRMPRFELARRFIKECGVPVVAPSANLSGKPSPTTWEAVFEDLNGRIDCILQGEQTEIGLESTVVDCTKDVPLVLRVGAVSLEALQAVVPETQLYTGDKTENLPSPGLKYRHYSPRARVVLINQESGVQSQESSAFIGLNEPNQEFELIRICPTVETYAHELFAFFREADEAGMKTIFCQIVAETGLGLALMDRLRRAAN
ncbi:MAG TPA: L-threonylcarbamoyladenylate synthase [Pyrinomonadaceae bacterium]|nr:L-threonylcarbamoyladenylate synthase [Pyrinomonadaceae bacterium]